MRMVMIEMSLTLPYDFFPLLIIFLVYCIQVAFLFNCICKSEFFLNQAYYQTYAKSFPLSVVAFRWT